MTETPWTPGPWTVEPSIGGWSDIVGADGQPVVRMDWYAPSPADAALIAAAPEMADALGLIRTRLQRLERNLLAWAEQHPTDERAARLVNGYRTDQWLRDIDTLLSRIRGDTVTPR